MPGLVLSKHQGNEIETSTYSNYLKLPWKENFVRLFFCRFGETRCLIATANIVRGDEILVNYKYDMDKFTPQWYRDLHKKHVPHIYNNKP